MAADPLAGVELDEAWVRSFERAEAGWSEQLRAVAALERLAADRVALTRAVPVPSGGDVTSGVRLEFADATVVSLCGVAAADAAAFCELSRTPRNRVVAIAAPEATPAGWRTRFSVTGTELGPVTLAVDAASLS